MITQPLLAGAHIASGPAPWQVIQRGPDGRADIIVKGDWILDQPSVVEARIASEYDNSSVSGCEWRDVEMLDGNAWEITFSAPTGGLYKIETRLRAPEGEWRLAGDRIMHIAVGDVWVIAGQSNAVGYGHGPVVDPPMLGVSLFGMDENWRPATHPIFDPTGSLHPANHDDGWVDVSPWLAFGKDVLVGAGVPVGLIPAALGGSPLSAWDPGTDADPYLYNNMLEMIKAAGNKVAGMVWYQGCSDSSEECASTYLERFTRMVEAFRAKFGKDLPVITAQLNRHYNWAPQDHKWWSIVREAQRLAARTIPNVGVVTTLDLPLSDGIHTGAAGNVLLGQRFAKAALGMRYGSEVPWKCVDVKEARFVDGGRKSIRVSFENVVDHLVFISGRPGDFIIEDESGEVPYASAVVDGTSDVVIELEHPAEGATVVHNMFGCDPATTLRDHMQRPVLAFYNLEVKG